MEFLDLLKNITPKFTHIVVEDGEAVTAEEWERFGRPNVWAEHGRVMLEDGEAVFYFNYSNGQSAVVYQNDLFKSRDIVEFGDYKVTFERGDSEPKWFKRIV